MIMIDAVCGVESHGLTIDKIQRLFRRMAERSAEKCSFEVSVYFEGRAKEPLPRPHKQIFSCRSDEQAITPAHNRPNARHSLTDVTGDKGKERNTLSDRKCSRQRTNAHTDRERMRLTTERKRERWNAPFSARASAKGAVDWRPFLSRAVCLLSFHPRER